MAAGGSLALSWRYAVRISGFALLAFFAATAVAYFTLPFGAVVVVEICMAMLMVLLSAVSWAEGNLLTANRSIMAISLIDFAWCGLTCWQNDTSQDAQTLFYEGANVLFLCLCAAVAAPGAVDVVRGRFRIGNGLRRYDDPAAAEEGS
jgi:hypothetical protein